MSNKEKKKEKLTQGPAVATIADSRREILIALALILAIIMIYAQVLGYQFVNFDDDAYVYSNEMVKAGFTWKGTVWAFTTFYFYWHPLTWLSHMLDCQLFGLEAGGHHLTNLLFHAASSVLLFLALRRMTGFQWRSAFVAALFALHPLQVEPVAWVAERKEMLSGFFWMLALWTYLSYAASPASIKKYLLVVVSVALGLMSKPTLVTIPFALLLLDFWPLRRGEPFARLVKEKLPLLALVAVSSVLTIIGQREKGAMATLNVLPIAVRAENALTAYAYYLGKAFWPHPLAVLYPYQKDLSPGEVAGAGLLLAGITAMVLWQARRRPYLVVGWLWFLGVLVPTIGFVQVGGQASADRFTYVPLIGLWMALVWLAADLTAGWRYQRPAAAVLAAILFPAMGTVSWAQVHTWRDSVTLFQHAIEVTSDNGLAQHNLGYALAEQGRDAEAIEHFSEALRIEPRYYQGHYNLGKALMNQGRMAEAAASFSEAVRLKPDYAEAHYSLALLLMQEGKPAEAGAQFREALRGNLQPEYAADAQNDLGVLVAQQGNMEEAVSHFLEALRSKPDFVPAHKNLAMALVSQKRTGEAIAHLSSALRVTHGDREIQNMLTALQSQSVK